MCVWPEVLQIQMETLKKVQAVHMHTNYKSTLGIMENTDK